MIYFLLPCKGVILCNRSQVKKCFIFIWTRITQIKRLFYIIIISRNRVICVIRALNLFLFCGRKTQRSEQSCRKQRFLCPAIFCISPNAIKRRFSFISSCQCIRPSICNLYSSSLVPFFRAPVIFAR